jgi:hypothetical protein
MHDPFPVSGIERARDLNRRLERLGERERALLQTLRQRLPLQVLDDDVVGPASCPTSYSAQICG